MKRIAVMQPDGTLKAFKVDNNAPLKPEWIQKLEAGKAVNAERKAQYKKRARKEIRRKYQRKDLQKEIAKMRTIIDKINTERDAGTLPALCDLEFALAIEAAEVSTEVRRKDVVLEAQTMKYQLQEIKECYVVDEAELDEFKL